MVVEVQHSGSPVVVDGVADEFVLQLAEAAEAKAREADRSKLRLATHSAERHQDDDVARCGRTFLARARTGPRAVAAKSR
jgi:hypothetical protein